jgi:hypothetical protein
MVLAFEKRHDSGIDRETTIREGCYVAEGKGREGRADLLTAKIAQALHCRTTAVPENPNPLIRHGSAESVSQK